MEQLKKMADEKKREEGRYYTLGDPFDGHPEFVRWAKDLPAGATIVEPFAGACHLVAHLRANGVLNAVDAFDIAPAAGNVLGMTVVQRDTLADFPQGYDAVVTNPPYLFRSSATRMGVAFPDGSDARDLYELALEKSLAASPMVAAVIPGSFVRSPRFRERLQAVVELGAGLFGDTDHPTCLALFGEKPTGDYVVWQGRTRLGMASELNKRLPVVRASVAWSFNDPLGSIGLRALDDSTGESIAFVAGEAVPAGSVKRSSKAVTRISGLPCGVDAAAVVAKANELFRAWRKETGGVWICPFKGARRRLDFGTARLFLNAALVSLEAANDAHFGQADNESNLETSTLKGTKMEDATSKPDGPGDVELRVAVSLGGQPERARQALAAGADPTRRFWDGRTMLHHSAKAGDHETCSLLLEHGADPLAAETEDWEGNSPLALALEVGGETASVLLKACRPESLDQGLFSCCRSRTVATRLAARMGAAELAKAAGGGKWRDVAVEALAKREKAELRKLAAKPKPKAAAKARGRL